MEVGDADGLDLARLVGVLQLFVASQVVAGRLVDVEQVNRVGIQQFQALVHRAVLLIDRGPQLGGDKDLVPRHAGFFDAAAHGPLVQVAVGGVHHSVAQLQRVIDGLLGFVGLHQKGANADAGHFDAVGKSKFDHRKDLLVGSSGYCVAFHCFQYNAWGAKTEVPSGSSVFTFGCGPDFPAACARKKRLRPASLRHGCRCPDRTRGAGRDRGGTRSGCPAPPCR